MFSKDSNILIVDDMITMRKMVKKALSGLGFENVKEFKNGLEAWQALANEKFDVIISDWNMPEMTGLELLKKVRATEGLSKLPFLLLTAESDSSQIEEAESVGVDAYITKPFKADDIADTLTRVYSKIENSRKAAA